MKTKYHIDRTMNKDTKLLRDKVMNIINEARYDRGYDLPFIKVRITDTKKRYKKVLGTASMGGNWIWIHVGGGWQEAGEQVVGRQN